MAWHSYSAAELEREYTPASRIENIQVYLDEYARAGQASRQKISHAKLQYGSHDDAWLWLAEHATSQKLIVFVHGGFWRRLSADDGTFLTPGWHDLGFNVASINYSLCPNESLSTLVNQTSQAIDFLLERYAANEITLVGHSAGAQLVAMKLCNPNSPINFVATAQDTSIAVIWGENETDEFKRQSIEFATVWTSVKDHSIAKQKEFEARNHFDILYELTSQHVIDLPSA